MRVLHTADWHFGRTLEGRSRHAEQVKFVDELCAIVRDQRIDLVLIAGDIYDGVNPSAEAEALYCEALARLGEGGRRAVVAVAGNHDNPERLGAVRHLAQRHGATIFGLPADDPGLFTPGPDRVQRVAAGPGWCEVAVPGVDHSAVVLALAYPSEARLSQLLSRGLGEGELQEQYSDWVCRWFAQQAAALYRTDALRLAMSHIFVAGGQESPESERVIQVGGAYTVTPKAFPEDAQYVALGHLHRPQQIWSPGPAVRYSGSPLAFSFSEVGYAKSVTVFEVAPGDAAPTSVTEIPLSAGRPLVKWKAAAGLDQVRQWLSEGRDAGAFIDLEVHVTEALRLDQVHELRRAHEGIIQIRPVIATPESEAAATREAQQESLEEQFIRFCRQRTGGAMPAPEVIRLFLELTGDEGEPEVES